jgi:ADP-ribose pyrophosphatase YjhB (NUDIX family)/GNAT superfamily N-acetyltransferase
MTKELKFAPREVFDQLLEYMVIPTFDLVIEYGQQGIVLVRRAIAPYQHQWALPGLRMFKGESIDDTLRRIARQEVGLEIDPRQKVLLGQFVGRFKTEHQRQDLSTGYWIKVPPRQPIVLNPAHANHLCAASEHGRDVSLLHPTLPGLTRRVKAIMIIRHATSADNILLAELGAQTFYETFVADNTPEDMTAYLTASFSPARQATELADPASTFLIAENDDATIGYARLKVGQPSPDVTGVRPIEIVRLYARQDWLGQGVGSQLMQACLDEAAKQGCDTVWLDVWEQNARARAFYRKWGFVEVGTQFFQLGSDLQHDLILQRSIHPTPSNSNLIPV